MIPLLIVIGVIIVLFSMRRVNKKLDEQSVRIETLAGRIASVERGRGADAKPAAPATASPPLAAVTAPAPEMKTESGLPPAGHVAAAAKETEEKKPAGSLEEKIGGKLFARIGIVVLVMGVSFFIKYAFDNDWIGETGRVILGALFGAALLAVGEKTIRKYYSYGQLVSGGGLAVLYLSAFASYNFYHLVSQPAAFFFMAIVTGIGIALSLRYQAMLLIFVAVVGGFATPFLLSSEESNMFGLFSYITLLDLAILAVSVFRKWRALNLVGFLGTVIVYLGWHGEYYLSSLLLPAMFFLVLFFLIYSLSSLVYNLVKKEESSGIEQIMSLAAGAAFFGASYALLNGDYHAIMGFFSVALAVYYFLWAYLVKMITPRDENLFGFQALMTVGFITIAIALQFEGRLMTTGWLVESALLVYLATKTREKAIMLLGVFISGMAAARLLFLDYRPRGPMELSFFNKTFFTALLLVAVFYLIAYLAKRGSGGAGGDEGYFGQLKKLTAGFLIAANFFTLFAFSREISFYYDDAYRKVQAEISRSYETRNTHKGAYNAYPAETNGLHDEARNIRHKKSISLSLFWLFYAIVLLSVGFAGRYKGVRLGGILLLSLAIAKLFFYDLWSLGTLYRIISSISLGMVLLLISFIYQKYKDKIKEMI